MKREHVRQQFEIWLDCKATPFMRIAESSTEYRIQRMYIYR